MALWIARETDDSVVLFLKKPTKRFTERDGTYFEVDNFSHDAVHLPKSYAKKLKLKPDDCVEVEINRKDK